MTLMTTTEANIIDNENPSNQKVALGTKIREAALNCLYRITVDITADATSGQTFTVPFNCELVDVIVQARAASAGGTATVRSATNAITDAIVMAVDTTVTRAGTIDDTYSSLTTSGSYNIITNGAADRGHITLVVERTV